MKILIIDDNHDITDMLSRYLTLKGFECSVSNSGMNGLSLIKKENFDHVFLDLSMPEFGGLDVIESLEKDDVLKNKNIIIFTASSISNNDVQKLLEKEGVNACLKKPVQLNELLTTIQR